MSNLTKDDLFELNALYRQMRGKEDLSLFVFGGKEGNRQSYVGKISFSDLSHHFNQVPSSEGMSRNVMLQRELVRSRATNIKNYILNHADFVFPEVIAIAESIQIESIESVPGLFKLTLPASCFRYLVDGQGRLCGIGSALKENSSLGNQTIDIKFIVSEGLEKDCQLFSDINMTPVAPNKSQCAAMDSRKAINRFAKGVIDTVPELPALIDYTKASVTASSTSSKLWTLNQFVAFVLMVTGTTVKSCEKELGSLEQQAYWTGFISKFLTMLRQNKSIESALSMSISAAKVREESIVGTSVFLKSLALMGKVIIMNFVAKGDAKVDWSIMSGWANIDLSKNNKEWFGRCMNYRGGYEDKSFNHKAMASYFLSEMGIPMPEELESVEEEVLLGRAAMLKAEREEKAALKNKESDLFEVSEVA